MGSGQDELPGVRGSGAANADEIGAEAERIRGEVDLRTCTAAVIIAGNRVLGDTGQVLLA